MGNSNYKLIDIVITEWFPYTNMLMLVLIVMWHKNYVNVCLRVII